MQRIGALVLLVFLLAPSVARADGKKAGVACKSDKDCVLVPDDCCDCAQGGKQKAIPVRDQKKDDAARKGRCKEQMCAQVVSADPSCSAKAICSSGHCALSTATPAAPAK